VSETTLMSLSGRRGGGVRVVRNRPLAAMMGREKERLASGLGEERGAS
jgi:hypothetical protein